MNYPLISEYVEAIKAAEDNFEQLKHLSPVLGEDGEPVMTSGNFAVVFKMKDEQTGKLHAVKCFLKEQEGRAEAYRQIAEELEYVSSTFLTHIKYLDKELFVDSANSEDSEFPVLLMDWVEGQTLDKYIREHIDDQYELSLLAYQFSRLAMWLMPQPFAHGDLKPDNILVKEDGTLVLVDYDGMYVPAMKGQKARELGSPDFRHPGRTEEVFDDHIDDFSLASILLSLKAIAIQPELLEKYGASDRLLFSEKDYRNLSESSALGVLQPLMQDAELASLYSLYILALSQNNLSQVSFRLFNLSRPDKSQFKEENLSTEVTDEDLANAWTDEFGVKYSSDRKRLFLIPNNIIDYKVRKGTKVICDYAFGHPGASGRIKNSLKSLYISADVKVISSDTLYGCQNLSQIIVDDKNSVFDSRENSNAIIRTKNNELLLGCQTTNIPKNITSIADYAFLSCGGLKKIHIPNSVITIGNEAFMNCSQITHIHLPSSLRKIGNRTFNGCDIEEVTIDDDNNVYDARNNCNAIISSADNRLVFGCKKTIIPDTVTIIGRRAFECCELKDIFLPNSVKTIEDHAFVFSELQSIYCSSSLNYIGAYAFFGCSKLASIKFGGVVKHIESDAFFGCDAVKKIIIPMGTKGDFIKTNPGWLFISKLEEQGVDANIKDTPKILDRTWVDDYGVKYSSDKTHLIKAPRDIIKYSIREGTKYINDRAFDFCVKLVSITIPESVMYVGDSAFGECHNLSEVKNSGKIETVGDFSFAGCRSLKSVKFNEGLVKMGGSVFKGCVSLHSVYIPSSVTFFGDVFPSRGIWLHANRVTTFDYCESLKDIIIPVGSRSKFEKLLPDYNDKLVEQNRGWRLKGTRPFSPEEIAAVARAEVVPSQYGNSVCFFMNGGGQTYIPLLSTSSLTVGESVDLKTAKLVTLCREGKDDIYRVIE